jgi:hypothetical protein
MRIKLYFTLLMLLIGGIAQSQTFTQMTGILNASSSSGEPCVLDMNGDHLDDVVRYTGGSLVIDYQQPDGTFQQQSYPANINNYPSWSVAGGDIDANGFNDLILGSGSQVSFVYANDSGTGYNEVNVSDNIFTQRTNMVDIDNDGNLDAFACHDVDQSHPFRNDGIGNLVEDQSLITTVPIGGNYASVWTDFDNDGDVDMYMSKCRGGAASNDPQRINGLYQNNGDGTFTEMAASVNMADNDQSWVTIFEDFDNDGDFDTYTVNHAWGNRLMENDGTGMFTEVTAGSGIDANDLDSWACIGADFDNDGFVDILSQSFANKEFYHNDGNLQFTAQSLPFYDGSLGDLNNDGFLDVWTGGTLWMNDANDNNWVKYSLQGTVSNINGIGARIEIYGDWGMQTRECRSGQSFAPMSTLDVHFGIGTFTSIDSTIVHWPSGIISTYYDLDPNQSHILPEAECTFTAGEVGVSGITQLCEGESIDLTAPEGYTYLWNTGQTAQTITVNSAGNYSVNLTDGEDCLAVSEIVQVSEVGDETPTVSLDGLAVFCDGGSVVLSSTEALSYLWSNEETGQSTTITESGTYSVSIEGFCGNYTSEEIEVSALDAQVPAVTDLEVSSTGTQEVSAGGENITWYEDELGSTVLGTGNTIEVDVPAGGTTVYASNTTIYEGISDIGGKLTNDGGGGLPSTGAYSYFDVWESFTLDQVTVYEVGGSPGNRTFQLVDENDNVLEQGTFFITAGENTVDLDWFIPEGEGMSLRCPENNLFRNSAGVNYPYALGTWGEIYDSYYGGQYYYYFYNWQMTNGQFECESDIVALNISVVTGIEELPSLNSLSTYPNPAQDELIIELDVKALNDFQVRLIDALGSIVVFEEFDHQGTGLLRIAMDIRHLAAGTYELQLSDSDASISRPIVKQ